MPEEDVIFNCPPPENKDWMEKFCSDIEIIDIAINDITWHADGSITKVNITGKEDVKRYLEEVKATYNTSDKPL